MSYVDLSYEKNGICTVVNMHTLNTHSDESECNGDITLTFKMEHWVEASKRLSNDAFKFYLVLSSGNNGWVFCSENRTEYYFLGVDEFEVYEKAFNELIEAGYIHRYRYWQGSVVYDFFLEPMTELEYYSYIDRAY